MARLYEYQSKKLLAEAGIRIPEGGVAIRPEEAGEITQRLGTPVVIKIQVWVTGRAGLGGIRFADTPQEAEEKARELLGMRVKNFVVEKVLVEEKLDMVAQFYVSIAIDRQAKTYIVLTSTEGGVDIEETALASPDKISRHWVDPDAGFSQPEAIEVLSRFGMNKDDAAKFASIISILYTVAMDNDAELVEINPLTKTTSGKFAAADARIIVDDNALFRHPELADRSSERVDDTPLEAEARKQNLAYVDLDGDIGIVGNGAGLGMATIDLVQYFGGRPANFLDVGGGGPMDIPKRGLLLVMSKPEVKAVLVNILGGITRCDIVAQGIIEALNASTVKKPIAVRMMGTNEVEGIQMLHQAGINSYPNMEKAVEEIVKL